VAFSKSFLYLRPSQKFCGGTYHIHYNAAATSYYMVAIIAFGVWSNWACRYGNVNWGCFFLFFLFLKNIWQGNKRRKRKGPKSKQKTTPENAKCPMGSPKRRKHKT